MNATLHSFPCIIASASLLHYHRKIATLFTLHYFLVQTTRVQYWLTQSLFLDICKNGENKRLEKLKTFLCPQKYFISGEAIWNAKQIPISELRKVNREKTPGNSFTEIPFVVFHNPRNHNIFNTTMCCLPFYLNPKL